MCGQWNASVPALVTFKRNRSGTNRPRATPTCQRAALRELELALHVLPALVALAAERDLAGPRCGHPVVALRAHALS